MKQTTRNFATRLEYVAKNLHKKNAEICADLKLDKTYVTSMLLRLKLPRKKAPLMAYLKTLKQNAKVQVTPKITKRNMPTHNISAGSKDVNTVEKELASALDGKKQFVTHNNYKRVSNQQVLKNFIYIANNLHKPMEEISTELGKSHSYAHIMLKDKNLPKDKAAILAFVKQRNNGVLPEQEIENEPEHTSEDNLNKPRKTTIKTLRFIANNIKLQNTEIAKKLGCANSNITQLLKNRNLPKQRKAIMQYLSNFTGHKKNRIDFQPLQAPVKMKSYKVQKQSETMLSDYEVNNGGGLVKILGAPKNVPQKTSAFKILSATETQKIIGSTFENDLIAAISNLAAGASIQIAEKDFNNQADLGFYSYFRGINNKKTFSALKNTFEVKFINNSESVLIIKH